MITSPIDGDIAVTMGLVDGEGVRFLTTDAFFNAAMTGERFRVDHDTVDELPASVSENDVGCSVLAIEDFSFGEPDRVPGEGDSCVVDGVDSFGDVQATITVANPFAETADLAMDVALRDGTGVRWATPFTIADVVAPGESVRVSVDTLTDPAPWFDLNEATCEILTVSEFGF